MKPALSPQTTGFLPRSRSSACDVGEHVGLGDDGADDLDEVLHRRRVEEVDADDPAGLGVGGGDLGDAERGGVGGQDRVRADDAVERPEDRLLDLERLHDRLDDEVGVGEVLQLGGEGDPAEQLGLPPRSSSRASPRGRSSARGAGDRVRRPSSFCSTPMTV